MRSSRPGRSNRGMNQPVIDLRTTLCYISPQNHGSVGALCGRLARGAERRMRSFAVDNATLPPDWKQFFTNANDSSNEGIIHTSKPFFAVQARGRVARARCRR